MALSKIRIGQMLHAETIKQILALCGSLPFCRIWPNNTGAVASADKKRFIRYGLKGSADISGILEGGRRLEIEVKTGEAKQSCRQVDFQRMIEKFGGVYILTGTQNYPKLDPLSFDPLTERLQLIAIEQEIVDCARLNAMDAKVMLEEVA